MGQFQRQCRDKMWNKMSSLSAKKSCTSGGEKIFLSSPGLASSQNSGSITNKSRRCEQQMREIVQILKIRQENALRGIFVGELA